MFVKDSKPWQGCGQARMAMEFRDHSLGLKRASWKIFEVFKGSTCELVSPSTFQPASQVRHLESHVG